MPTTNTTLALVTGVALGAGAVALLRRLRPYRPPKTWAEPPSDPKAPFQTNSSTAGARKEQALEVGKHPVQLYSLATPNGMKATIMLEELCEALPDFDYDAWRIEISGAQFTSGFVDVCPNSKIPAMVDTSTGAKVFESGAILVYLAEKYPQLGLLPPPSQPTERAAVMSWLMWQMGSAPFLGGGFGHFYNYAPVKIEYAINRYAMETKRQLDVLDKQLAKHPYVAGDTYSIADIAIWPWYGGLVLGRLYGAGDFLSVQGYTNVIRWAKQLEETRPAVRRGRMVNRKDPDTTNAAYKDLPALPNRHGRGDWKKA